MYFIQLLHCLPVVLISLNVFPRLSEPDSTGAVQDCTLVDMTGQTDVMFAQLMDLCGRSDQRNP